MTETPDTTGAGAAATSDAGNAAALRVLRGEPTAEELAALVAVLAARGTQEAGGAAGPVPISGWTERSRYVRSGRPEFGARVGWRASALPR